jgi:uncharacterized protein with FMN-binding domain
MRKPVLAVMTGLTALVLGLGIRAGGSHHSLTAAGASVGVVAVSPTTPSGSTSATPSQTATTTTATSSKVNGQAQWTRYGAVQVQIVVKDKKIVSAEAIQYPTQDPRDQEINSYAVPQLNSEAVQAQSGSIGTVSGATFTSDGYIGSLQSAIDQAQSAGLL